jgi:hypothetical protein
MRHTRTPIVLKQAYYREVDSSVKAQMVRVATSLMAENTGAGDGVQVAEQILKDALENADGKVRRVAEEIVAQRRAAAVAS